MARNADPGRSPGPAAAGASPESADSNPISGELCGAATSRIAEAIRDGSVSSRAMLETYLERIERLDPAINAIVATDPGTARARADAADQALARGESWGPLHGVPFTIKDTFDVTGLPTVCGLPRLVGYEPSRNAVAVQRLIDAGAVIFGKTNVPRLAQDLQTYNAVHGTTNNPWDETRTPGGSSGGPAAALAAGLTGGELGSDTGGSIRTPAHYCGIYGHKPSYGLIPTRGHIPGPPGTLSRPDLSVVGPLGRSARDLALLLDVLAGPDAMDGRAWRLELPREDVPLADQKVLAWLDDDACPVDRSMGGVLRETADLLRAAGATVEEGPPAEIGLREVHELYMSMLAAVVGGGIPSSLYRRFRRGARVARALRRTRPDRLGGYAAGATQSHRAWLKRREAREKIRRRWEALLERYDLILMPVTPLPSIRHLQKGNLFTRTIRVNGERRPYTDLFPWISPASLLRLPATVAPVGTVGGLPVGIQIVGPYLHDHRTIRFAERLAELVPPPTLPVEWKLPEAGTRPTEGTLPEEGTPPGAP